MFYHTGSSRSVGSTRKGRKHWSAWTYGCSWRQRIQWWTWRTGDARQYFLSFFIFQQLVNWYYCKRGIVTAVEISWRVQNVTKYVSVPTTITAKIKFSKLFNFHLFSVRVLMVNLDHPALQALLDPPPQLWKTSSFPLTTMTWMAVACRMLWNSSRTKWPLILLHPQRWTKTRLFPIRTRLPCVQTLESTPHWRPSADICKTSAVLTAARWTLQKPARTSSSATLRNRAVRLLFSDYQDIIFIHF